MPVLTPEETGEPVVLRWPPWAVVTSVLIFAALVYVGFHYMRGRYLVGGSAPWTLFSFGALFVGYGIVILLTRRARLRASRSS